MRIRLMTVAAVTGIIMGVAARAGAFDAPASRSSALDSSPLLASPATARVALRDAWSAFRDGAREWRALFDTRSGVLLQAAGPGIPLPMASLSPPDVAAALHIWAQEHRTLLGGAGDGNPSLVTRRFLDSARRKQIFAFQEMFGGVPIVDAFQLFVMHDNKLVLFASERGSTTRPLVVGSFTRRLDESVQSVMSTLQREGLQGELVTAPHPAYSLDTRPRTATLRPVHVIEVRARPRGVFRFLIDAAEGTVVHRMDRVHYQEMVRLSAEVEPRTVGDERQLVPLQGVLAQFPASGTVVTDEDGMLKALEPTAAITLSGPNAVIVDGLGRPIQESTNLDSADGTRSLVWGKDEATLAQLDAWHFVHQAIALGRRITPDLPWLAEQMNVHVNVEGQCNAFYDGNGIHFFRESASCNNTARIMDVVVHEWGHGYHDHLAPMGITEGAADVSEGQSDYWSATLTNDPQVGPNFTTTGGIVRDIAVDRVYPRDLTGQIHRDGLIWAGAWWDLRSLFIKRYGFERGVARADVLHASVLQTGPRLIEGYERALILDDDDADLANGTPHSCEINTAFGWHGLDLDRRPASALLWVQVEPVSMPIRAFQPITVDARLEAPKGCALLHDTRVSLVYSMDGSEYREVAMEDEGDTFRASIPGGPAGSVVRYFVAARAVETDTRRLVEFVSPVDATTTPHTLSIGIFDTLASWDFEDGGRGWSHSASRAADDEWEIGSSRGRFGDPGVALSGAQMAGIDLSVGNGAYRSGAQSALTSPSVDCAEKCSGMRLHFWRWLRVRGKDRARVLVNDVTVWESPESGMLDGEWTFQDISLAPLLDSNGALPTTRLQVRFELVSDPGTRQAAGWNVDDVAFVSVAPGQPDHYAADLAGGCACSLQTRTVPVTRPIAPSFALLGLALLLRRRRRCA